jgi:hypothetical protein
VGGRPRRELPILQQIHDTEQELIAPGTASETRQERGVFIDEMARQAARMRAIGNASTSWRMRTASIAVQPSGRTWSAVATPTTDPVASTEQDYMEIGMARPA